MMRYNQHTSQLKNEDGTLFKENPYPPKQWKEVFKTSPTNPAKKVSNPTRLRIQLGLGCNYTCSYCLQASEIHKASATSIADANIFIKTLDKWLTGIPTKIEFWGGEPLLYWKKIEVLAPALIKKFPDAQYIMITNGSLLTPEINQQIDDWGFGIGMSHDGPGYHLRGLDPLDNPEQREQIEDLMQRLLPKGRFSFNAVLTPASYDVSAVIDWFNKKFDVKPPNTMPINFEGVVHDYNGDDTSRFTEDQLTDLQQKLYFQIIDQSALRSSTIIRHVDNAINSILMQRPSFSLGQKCAMDREDQLAVDLLGNIMTCQNTGAKGRHRLGHVNSLDKAKLTTAYHWENREECKSCPVLQLCQGSCMYQEGDNWTSSCNSEFAFNKAIFAGALFFMTGAVLERIEGNIIRPSYSK